MKSISSDAGWVVNEAQPNGVQLFASLREIWQYRPLIFELVRRDLKVRYKNSIGGIAWSLFNPLMQVFVITVVMKFLLPRPVENYSAYVFGAIFLWSLIQASLLDGCVSVLQNAQLVRKIYFPRAILPLTTLLGSFFHFGISFVFIIIYLFIVRAYPEHWSWRFFLVVPVIFFLMVLCLGISYFLAYLNVFYEDVRFILSAFMGLLFYALPILYPVEKVAEKGLLDLYLLNPIATFLVMFQRALMPPPVVQDAFGNQIPSVGTPWGHFAIACLVSTLTLIAGFALFEKNKWQIGERL
ncbi:MAG TPA: ABC transporter permease [Abditibacteriaceae bacterium]|jgi:ABC-type polysaccharide/polyol phosphate export permease